LGSLLEGFATTDADDCNRFVKVLDLNEDERSTYNVARKERTTVNQNDLMLWAATVRNKSFRERIEAAQVGGFSSMSMFPLDYTTFIEQGTSLADMRAMMADSGVRVTVLDPLSQWTPTWTPPESMSDSDLAFLNYNEDEFFRIGEALGIESMSVIEPFMNNFPEDDLIESFATVCDRAAKNGWKVHLEFMPTSSINSLATAWTIVKGANRSNGGLVFDTWHYFRSDPDDELLRTVPGESIFRVQVADAAEQLRGGSVYEDLLHYRLPPGEGDFPLVPTVRILRDIGGLSSVGLELFSDAFDALKADEVGKRAGSSLRQFLNEVL
jgi:sugar phosphate isomerase/epimerase